MSYLRELVGKVYPMAIGEEEKAYARLCLLDALGCGLYSSRLPEGLAITRGVCGFSGGTTPVWGTGYKAGPDGAAFANGALCHLREMDDVHPAILHPGAVVIPVALALAAGRSALLLYHAIVLGYEVMVRLSEASNYLRHRELGWHATATVGSFGAALTAAVLLGLDEDQAVNALGIAGSRTGGTWAFAEDGAMSKRLHPGMAARDGLQAAFLAREGVTGPAYALESTDGGFFHVASENPRWEKLWAPRLCAAIRETEFKNYASCKSVHAPIEAALALGRKIPVEKIGRIQVELNQSAMHMAGRMYNPVSVTSAQLSIPYGIALGLTGRKGGVADYTPEQVKNKDVYRLAAQVEMAVSPEMDRLRREEEKSCARLTITEKSGKVWQKTVKTPKGSNGNPLTPVEINEKFTAMTKGNYQAVQEWVANSAPESLGDALAALL